MANNTLVPSPPSHYAILSLPDCHPSQPQLTLQIIKSAYRAALLKHHPDKTTTTTTSTTSTRHPSPYTIDQITTAYTTLSSPTLRAQYDLSLLLSNTHDSHNIPGRPSSQKFKTGVEIVDLDDMTCDEEKGYWYRNCRCGDDRGYVVREEELEDANREGESEVGVGCRGCSLWIRVLFGVEGEG